MTSSDRAKLSRCKAVPSLICNNPRIIVGAVFLLFLLALYQLYNPFTNQLNVKIDPSEKALLGLDHEGWEFYQLVTRNFGSDETIMLALDADDVFSPPSIDLVNRLTNRLTDIEGVINVISLTNAMTIRETDFGLDIAPIMKQMPETSEQFEALRNEVISNPLIAETLISADARTTAIIINLDYDQDQQFFKRINTAIDEIIAQEAGDRQVWVTGSTKIKHATTEIVIDDLLFYPPMITVLMMIILWVMHRSVVNVLVPLTTVIISVVFTVATITMLGYSLNILTALVPPLLMILTLSYSMYVVSDFKLSAQNAGTDEGEVVADILYKSSLPVLLAGLTTAAGFSSLYLSELNAIREFGLFSVIGVVYATIVTLTFTPSMLVLLKRDKYSGRPAVKNHETAIDRIIERIAYFDSQNRKTIFIVAGIVFVVSVSGMSQLRVGTEHITNFRADSDIRLAFEHANERLNGINPFNIVIKSKYPGAFKEPANLRKIEELQQWLELQPEVGGTTSLVDYVKFVNQAFNENDPASNIIPENKRTIGQLLFFTESDETKRLVDSSYRAINIVVRAKVIDSDDVENLISRVNLRLQQLPEHMEARATGSPVLMNHAIQDIMWGQVESVFLSLGIVYFILVSLFLSFRIGLIAIIPNLLPVVVYFGALGLMGISLNPSTSLIAPMILGVAIDDTIHYFARFNNISRETHDPQRATIMTLGAVGRPVTYTSFALCAGFLILTSSDLRMQAQVGGMASFAILVAWISDFFLTPALCSRLRIATLWDVVTLDLGTRPQDTIPLLTSRILAMRATIRA